jgi:hypothetical protein
VEDGRDDLSFEPPPDHLAGRALDRDVPGDGATAQVDIERVSRDVFRAQPDRYRDARADARWKQELETKGVRPGVGHATP